MTSDGTAVGDGSRGRGVGLVVAGSAAMAGAGSPVGAFEATESGAPAALSRRVASQPPKNKAVMAIHTKIENRARCALTLSCSLTMGKMAL